MNIHSFISFSCYQENNQNFYTLIVFKCRADQYQFDLLQTEHETDISKFYWNQVPPSRFDTMFYSTDG